jgi:hypothetical protein
METTPRRRKKSRPSPKAAPDPERLLPKLRERLGRERIVLVRHQARLLRVFHAWEKQTRLISRLERRISKLEQP